MNYGYDLGAFLRDYPPCAQHLYLADVAHLEAAWQKAYMAQDAQALDPQTLAQVPPEKMADLRFHLHPSSQFLQLDTPASQIWEATFNETHDERIDPSSGGEHLLILRPGADVEVRRLKSDSYAFLIGLYEGKTLGEAYGAAMMLDASFDLQNTLASHLDAESFTGFSLDNTPSQKGQE